MGRKRLIYIGRAVEYLPLSTPIVLAEVSEEDQQRLDVALALTKPRQRDALTMRADGHTFKMIGQTLGVERQSAHGLVQRAVKAARGQGRASARCGTLSGYRAHLRRQEPTCEPCREAQADHQRRYRVTNRNADKTPNT